MPGDHEGANGLLFRAGFSAAAVLGAALGGIAKVGRREGWNELIEREATRRYFGMQLRRPEGGSGAAGGRDREMRKAARAKRRNGGLRRTGGVLEGKKDAGEMWAQAKKG